MKAKMIQHVPLKMTLKNHSWFWKILILKRLTPIKGSQPALNQSALSDSFWD